MTPQPEHIRATKTGLPHWASGPGHPTFDPECPACWHEAGAAAAREETVRARALARGFWTRLREQFFDREEASLDYDEFLDVGITLGLLREEPYNPRTHGELDANEGDLIVVETETAKAWRDDKP